MNNGVWWITFSDRKPACVYGGTEAEARALAAKSGTVVSVLPYPADPRLDDRAGWGEGQCPSFCHDPNNCAGRTSCPNRRSCVE